MALGLILVIVLVVAGSDDADPPPPSPEEVGDVLEGIPQQGIALGDPDAPVTLVEFADPQCPFCAEYSREVLPDLVDEFVRAGQLRLELDLLTFIGPDSERIARAAYAVSFEDRLWQYAEIAFARQGMENSNYATDGFLLGIAEEIEGLDSQGLLQRAARAPISRRLRDAGRAARQANIQSTPSFLIGSTGGELEPLAVDQLDAGLFIEAIEEALSKT